MSKKQETDNSQRKVKNKNQTDDKNLINIITYSNGCLNLIIKEENRQKMNINDGNKMNTQVMKNEGNLDENQEKENINNP